MLARVLKSDATTDAVCEEIGRTKSNHCIRELRTIRDEGQSTEDDLLNRRKDLSMRLVRSGSGLLQVGDEALTDFNGEGWTLVTITARKENTTSQSGVCYQVSPMLKGSDDRSWYDAAWFTPCPARLLG